MGLTFATPNGGNSAKTGHKNTNNNAAANQKTKNYSGSAGQANEDQKRKASAGKRAEAQAVKDRVEAAAKAKRISDAGKANEDQKRKAAADARAKAQAVKDRVEAAAKAKRISDAGKANEEQKRKASETVRAKAQADKVTAEKALAEKEAKRKAVADENAAIEAESKRLLAESAVLTAAVEAKKVADAAAKTQRDADRSVVVQEKRDGLLSGATVTPTDELAVAPLAETPVETPVETSVETPVETKSTSQGLIDSFIPDFISESLKGKGNYTPEWVEKNKAAGAKHLENLYASGELQFPRSNFTDASGNAIGGVSNSQENVAMQRMAAKGVANPLATLSKEVSDGSGIDTSFSGAFRQAIDGADGHEYSGGSGLLKYANDQAANEFVGEGISEGTVDKGLADAVAADADSAAETTQEMVNGVPVDDLSSVAIDMEKFSGNLGFKTMGEAQKYWDSMTPEAQAIFNSKEHPKASDKILTGVFGLMIPGFGLLNKFMYNDDMTLQEKLEFSKKTAIGVARNKQQMKDGTNQNAGGGGGSSTPTAPAVSTEPESTYSNLDSYLSKFNNYTF